MALTSPAFHRAMTEPVTNEPRWRVVLLEDDAQMRGYFESCVRAHPALWLAASFGLLTPARAWFDVNTADVLLADLALPDGHALALIRELAQQQPSCALLVVSVFGDEDTVIACVEAGAVGYVHKDATPADVSQLIVDVMHGASPISPMIARKLLDRLRRQGDAPPPERIVAALPDVVLSHSESEVLELIARGYAYAEIARLRSVTIHTVQTHIRNLYAKLAVHSRSEAVFEASRLGLLDSMKPGGRA
jgi:DNA-binding NarL/FixJ family response regulator